MKRIRILAPALCLLAGAALVSFVAPVVAWSPDQATAGQKGKPGDRKGEINTPPAKGERLKDRIKVGDRAPDFTLPSLDGKTAFTLSSFQGKRPVVLIFGSYT